MLYNLADIINHRKQLPHMKHDTLRRFAYIETCLYWGTGLTARHFGEVFDIARQNAQKVINDYREKHPDNLYYDSSKKCHCKSDEFTPWYINLKPERYLGYIGAVSATIGYWDEVQWSPEIPFETDNNYLSPPQHHYNVSSVLSSIREKYAIHVVYRAKKATLAMTVSAHHLVYANYRYHVRAYDHSKDWFSDLVLTRFVEIEKAKENWVSSASDAEWNKDLQLRFQINPELPDKVQQALQADYSLGTGTIRTIEVRQALLGYICREMERVDWDCGIRLWLDMDKTCYQKRQFHS